MVGTLSTCQCCRCEARHSGKKPHNGRLLASDTLFCFFFGLWLSKFDRFVACLFVFFWGVDDCTLLQFADQSQSKLFHGELITITHHVIGTAWDCCKCTATKTELPESESSIPGINLTFTYSSGGKTMLLRNSLPLSEPFLTPFLHHKETKNAPPQET